MSGKPKVLVVDDDRLLRMSMQLLLEQEGYAVDTAADVATAMDSLDRGCYGLVLTDLRLPDGDGLEVVRYARRLNGEAKVILMTGSEEELEEDEILCAGAMEVLIKPYASGRLLTSARNALDAPRPKSAE